MPKYHITIKGKTYDRALYETALEAVRGQGDGRISRDDAEKLLDKVLDAAPGQADAYTDVEKRTVRLLREQLNWTPAADAHFRHAVASVAALKGWQTRLAAIEPTRIPPRTPLSVPELVQKICDAWPPNPSGNPHRLTADGVPEKDYKRLSDRVREDLSAVDFNSENTELSGHYQTLPDFLGVKTLEDGTPYLAVSAGGDWEFPLVYVIYWDGEQLRGYIPKEGNVYNKTNNAALGNLEEDQEADEVKRQLEERGTPLPADRANDHWQDTAHLLVDRELLLADIKRGIAPD